ncbi:MAG: glycosyltransferase [Bacteroidales bacterium]|nr:glycosyltransferase [Bacteroidales bacterium]MCM1414582.1 glycosyltransferase [bacterium]MCM1423869.1 glycosyltransferase [bacterium]
MKRLLLIVPSLHQGGTEKVCAMTARILKPYFDVRIAVFDARNIDFDVEGIPVTDIGLPSRPGKFSKVWNVLRRGARLKKLIRRERIEIAYSMGPTANLAVIFAGNVPGVKRWMGVMSYMDLDNSWLGLFCKRCDRLLCCSETLRGMIEKQYGCDHAYTLQGSFDIDEMHRLAERFQPKLPWKDGRIIVSMGREDVVKGFWHLLKIFALVHEKLPDTRLMIIGKGEFTEYRKLADDLGIADAVCFTGLQKNPYPYLKQGTLYLLTSYWEGFPNALVEGMAMGMAAVATDCMTGPAEIFGGKYGVLVPNMGKDPDLDASRFEEEERIAAARVIELLSDGEKLSRYRALAVERASVYSVEAYIQKIREWADD